MLKYEGKLSGIPTEKLLIIYETEAKQWATYLQSAFAGQIPEDGICCYDVNTPSRKDDFVGLSRYACKLLILSKGMLEDLHQMRRFFLSRVLSPAACVVVLLCGVDSLTPLLDQVPIDADECLQISCEQDAPEYVCNVMDIIQKGTIQKNQSPLLQFEQRDEQMQASGDDGVTSRVVIVPSRVPCGVSEDTSPERRTFIQKRVKPVCWSERILSDFPAGNVSVTVYSGGKTLTSSKLQYYTRIEELTHLLSSVADPVEFMCQALQACSVEKLDQKLSSMLLALMPTGGFQGLQVENSQERGTAPLKVHHGDVPSLLHFAARYGFRSISGLLLQCPGAERALRTANRHGQTPAEIAKSHGHKELHVILKEKLVTPSKLGSCLLLLNLELTCCDSVMLGSGDDNSVYEMISTSKIHAAKTLCAFETLFIMVVGKQRQCEGEDEDLYTPLGVDDELNSNFKSEKTLDLTNRPPAPTPRPECMQLKEGKTPYIAQGNTFCCLIYLLMDALRDSFVKECSTSATYDTFVPNQMQREQLAELQQRIKTGSLSMAKAPNHISDQQQVKKSDVNRQEVGLHSTLAG
uniref:DBB domain-containing protein n=1 Tax=Poecilia reticulata TaxID=8081 RepID=A0A3P9Q5G3_POERE